MFVFLAIGWNLIMITHGNLALIETMKNGNLSLDNNEPKKANNLSTHSVWGYVEFARAIVEKGENSKRAKFAMTIPKTNPNGMESYRQSGLKRTK